MNHFAAYLLLFLLILDGEAIFMSKSRIITTKYGALQGSILSLPGSLDPVEVYLGVPYATPPLRELRYVPPVTPPPWKNVRQASRLGAVCPQNYPDISNVTEALKTMSKQRLATISNLIKYLRNQSEDCLYLNIYSPYQSKFSPLHFTFHRYTR